MKFQKDITVPELINLCEKEGYNKVLNALKEIHQAEKDLERHQNQAETIEWLEDVIYERIAASVKDYKSQEMPF